MYSWLRDLLHDPVGMENVTSLHLFQGDHFREIFVTVYSSIVPSVHFPVILNGEF